MEDQGLSELKNVLYVDKVLSGISEIRRRMREPSQEPLDLRFSELRVFSQNGEDGITVDLLRHLAISNPFFVEFGVGDGWSCNTRLLAEVFGWSGLYLEIDDEAHRALQQRYRHCNEVMTQRAAVTPDNINELFAAASVPARFGVLSIDIDGQDYWVWNALSDAYQPDIVIVEINPSFGASESVTERLGIQEGPLTATYGASISAMAKLASKKGYSLVHVEMAGANAFFIRDDHANGTSSIGITQRSPNFGLRGRFHSLEVLYGGEPEIPRQTLQV